MSAMITKNLGSYNKHITMLVEDMSLFKIGVASCLLVYLYWLVMLFILFTIRVSFRIVITTGAGHVVY